MKPFLLQQILLRPDDILTLDLEQIQLLVSQARCSRLLASLAELLNQAGLSEQLSDNIWRHFQSEILIHEKQKRDLGYESEKIRRTLAVIDERLILLKGAAYILADLPVGCGRLITDIDIIVPHSRIDEVEKNFNQAGWESSYLDSYNGEYYRKWGHEIPPLTDIKRGTTLDVHHNILPPTAGPNVDPHLLFDEIVEVKPGVFTLSLKDMVIHSATHLFHEGEFHHGLRDLWDLDVMLRDFPQRDPDFWDGLVARANELELTGSLYHGLNYVRQVFSTPVPVQVLELAQSRSRRLRKPLMDFLFLRAFRPDHPHCRLPLTGAALFMLYIRSHYLRMPLYLLLPHLTRKAWMGYFEKEEESLEEAIEKKN
ncbi:MAG: hypothetical protein ACI9JM_000056 [Halioglobus sp.]|jgi:hypothetical protein